LPDESASDGDLRRRAAWFLGMLALVAVLLVVVMTTLLSGGKGSGDGDALGPSPITSTGPSTASPHTSAKHVARSSRRPAGSTGADSTASSGSPSSGAATCPTSAPCALDTDVGDAIPAINAYRTEHGMPPVPGSVSDEAKQCALNRGNGCSGGWAETELSAPPDGKLAVSKISQFARLLDPSMKAIEVGWAYNPATKTYYFSTIRKP